MSAMASQISSVSGGKCFHLMTSLWFNGCAVQDHRCLTDSRTWKCAWSVNMNFECDRKIKHISNLFKHFSTLLRIWTHITTALLKCVLWCESVYQCCPRRATRRLFVPVVLVCPCLPDQDDRDKTRQDDNNIQRILNDQNLQRSFLYYYRGPPWQISTSWDNGFVQLSKLTMQVLWGRSGSLSMAEQGIQPMREDVTNVTSSLIGWYRAQP